MANLTQIVDGIHDEKKPEPKKKTVVGKKRTQNTITGKTLVITGSLVVNRVIARNLITQAGGNLSERVSTSVDYVVYTRTDTAKYRQACRLGVTLINESELWSMIMDRGVRVPHSVRYRGINRR